VLLNADHPSTFLRASVKATLLPHQTIRASVMARLSSLNPALSRCAANKLNNWLEPILKEGLNHFSLPLDKNVSTKIRRKLTRFMDDPNNLLTPIISCC
jgi:hypothetical protein